MRKILVAVLMGLWAPLAVRAQVDPLPPSSPQTKDERNIILQQPDAPVKILSLKSYYLKGGRYLDEGIYFTVEYENVSGRPIQAIQFGLLSFDVFNEFLDSMGGVTMDELAPGKKDKGEWRMRALRDFMHWTGLVYVRKVRFKNPDANGVIIWKADMDDIIHQIKSIMEEFDASMLEEKREQ